MATTLLRLFSKHALTRTCQCVSVYKLPLEIQSVRLLYAQQTLGMDGFNQQQERSKAQMVNIADKFREKMTEYSSDDSNSMIFTEDLKNMIHISDTDEDIDIVIKMIKKFNAQNNQVRFGNFVFGPVVMRLFYKYNKVDEALELFKSSELTGFFDQMITYQILLDLLYENKKYQEILDVFEDIKNRQLENKYAKNAVVLVMAACYKLNTPESTEYTLKLWKNLNHIGHLPMRRATTFAAGLALNQNKPEIALEILVSTRNQNYTTVRNIKVLAYASLGRSEDALVILKSVLSEDVASANKIQTFNKNVVEKVKEAVLKTGNAEITAEFNRIESLLLKQGHIVDQTLDEQLTSEIQSPPILNNRDRFQQQDRYQSPGYRRNSNYQGQQQQQQGNRNRSYTYSQRPGLNELV